MANVTKLIAGGVSAYTTCGFTSSDFNSLANGSFVISDSVLVNGSNLDLLAEVSFIVTVGGTTTAGAYLALWVMPENRDGTTYGDTIADGSVLPAATYFAGACGVKVGVTSGNTIVGTFPRLLLPRDDFKLGLSNHVGVALNATPALTCEYRTTNFNLNG
jgi:hypothetical protein